MADKAGLKIAVVESPLNGTLLTLAVDKKTGEKITLPHRDATAGMIKEALPNAQVSVFQSTQSNSTKDVHAQLDEILKSGEKYDAINFSCGLNMDFDTLSKAMGMEITPKNIKNKTEEIKKFMISLSSNSSINKDNRETIKEEIEIIKDLETLASKGTKIYMSAGNDGNGKFNIFSLAKGVTTIGGLNEFGNPNQDYCNNSLVKRYAQGIFYPQLAKDENGKLGIDFNDDSHPNLVLAEKYQKDTSSIELREYISGTSFSAPTALAKDFADKRLARK